MTIFAPVSADVSFADEEKRVLALWAQADIFRRSVEARPVDKSYIFYDGPPFATGLPHYGHLVASTLKDIVPRYWTMRGYRVERRFGWDTHGLPIEMDVEKKLGLKGPSDVRAFGVDKFNEECRAGVLRYVDDWEKTITRVGRWVDFDDDYKTMDLPFMESVWWVFSQLWEKGLVYQGHRVMPYSWRLSTALSNFEAGLDYRDVDDPALTVRLPLDGRPGEFLLIWTTTPWTLPSNLAVAVHPDVDYSRVQTDDGAFWVGSALVKAVFGDKGEVTESKKGQDLAGLSYQPLFPFFADRKDNGSFRVVTSEHVTINDGTGLVHMAPAFGEDDYAVCKKNGIEIIDPVDDEGNFGPLVPTYAGRNVKEADKDIIRDLKAQGSIFKHATIKHSYPYCWRSGTPLIYKTTPSWYVKVEKIRDQMVQANEAVHWVPDFVGEARFNNWLKEARDWSISRSRFWGTPIPIWRADDGDTLCIGSVAELQTLTGAKVTDLHPHKIDHLVIEKGGKTYQRVKDVFDCWFESGSMPWAQVHYPFENKERFDAAYPAQFIAEGLDQTRGWFYTLNILGTALTGQSPFKNVVVNGMVLAKGHYKGKDEYVPGEFVDEVGGRALDRRDGAELRTVTEKMSKQKKNYTAPEAIIETFGADALRAYLINSPVVRGEPLRFEDEGVKEIVRTVLLPLQNALSFFVTYANIDAWDPKVELSRAPSLPERPELDRWILSVLQSLIGQINTQMEGYYLYKVVPPMLGFIDDLTNWYIRRSRRRFWKAGDSTDKRAAYATLYEVLTTFARVTAPVMPFVSESLYQRLVKDPGAGGVDSVHLCDYPLVDESRIDRDVEASIDAVRKVVVLGRALRERHKLKTRQPLQTVTVVSHDDAVRARLQQHKDLVADELNVKEVIVVKNDAALASLSFKANFKTLGKKLGPRMKAAAAVIEQLSREQWSILEEGGAVVVEGADITRDDVLVTRTASGEVVLMTEGPLTVALDTRLSDTLVDEGLVREVTSKLQQLRRDGGFAVTDRIEVRYATSSDRLRAVMEAFRAEIADEVLARRLVSVPTLDLGPPLDVNGHELQAVVDAAP